MFKSVLIANRGEIACRIMRTAKRMGLRTIAVHSRADRNALHVQEADEAHEIGPSPAAQSYLRADRILEVAQRAGADCIHPGYGFLSENAEFAEACAAAGIVFVGPPPSAIRAMGLKDEAKALMRRAGVPVVPGYDGDRQDVDFLRAEADRIGYPVLIKAVAGGGGKGMRRVDHAADFADALAGAQREARNSFGNDRVLIEKYILAPHHIEMQIFGDSFGNVVHLFERDCSLQRRHQKVIEEAPAPGMTEELRAAMGAAAVAAAKAVNYTSAGTVEFIVDGSQGLRPDGFWFMEMNTRLQVEHPVTEAITGLDLVELQIRIAEGEALPFLQEDLFISGHAVEARLYAEDPANGFLPSTGPVAALDLAAPSGVRVDAGVAEGGAVTPYYDPMIAKIIALGQTREDALLMLQNALENSLVAGPRTNRAFLAALVSSPAFGQGDFDTGYIERHLQELVRARCGQDARAVALGAAALMADMNFRMVDRVPVALSLWGLERGPWDVADAFRLAGSHKTDYRFDADGQVVTVSIGWTGDGLAMAEFDTAREVAHFSHPAFVSADNACTAWLSGGAAYVIHNGEQTEVRLHDPAQDTAAGAQGSAGDGVIRSPMHGKLVALLAENGEQVRRGQRLAIVEAMKMEHVLVAPRDGVVQDIFAAAGAQVALGARLLTVGD